MTIERFYLPPTPGSTYPPHLHQGAQGSCYQDGLLLIQLPGMGDEGR